MSEKKYKYVYFNEGMKKFHGRITHKKKVYECGYHDDEKQAVLAVDLCIIKRGLDRDKLQILKPK